MTFSYTKEKRPSGPHKLFGNVHVTMGTWTASSTESGGDIDTGLGYLYGIQLTPHGSSASAAAPTYNETIPGNCGAAVSILFTAGVEGCWIAYGEP